jgi:hypothetical protein
MLGTVPTEASRTARVPVFTVDDGAALRTQGRLNRRNDQTEVAAVARQMLKAARVAGAPTAPETELSCAVADGTDEGRSRRRV